MTLTGQSPNNQEIIEFGISTENGFIRNILIPVEKVEEYIKKYNNKGVYTTVYRYDNQDQDNANLIGPFYLDLDSEEDFEKARQDAIQSIKYLSRILGIDKTKIAIYFSGKKGIHITVDEKILGIQPCKNLNDIYKMLAVDINDICKNSTIDLGIYDRRRMFRIPQSKHQDTRLYKTLLTYDELFDLSIEEIQRISSSPREIDLTEPELSLPAQSIMNGYKYRLELKDKSYKKKTYKNKISKTPPCIKYLLDNEVEQGKRNNCAIVLCSFYLQRGFTYEQAEEKIIKWNEEHCIPKLSKIEIIGTLKSAYKKGYEYGCTTLRDLSFCDTEKCNLGRRRVH